MRTGQTLEQIDSADYLELNRAMRLLERPSFASRLTDVLGMPVHILLDRLPQTVSKRMQDVVTAALLHSLQFAVSTLGEQKRPPALWRGKFFSGLAGGAGGLFGLAALAVELPVTTTLMLRSIAEIARSEGEDLRRADARLACLEVFALGGRGLRGDQDLGYYATRAALAQTVDEAAAYLVERGMADQSVPVIVRFVEAIAARFGVVVSEKAAAGAIPLIGALGGASINVVFLDHFQNIARGHFLVRRLERKYGSEVIRGYYAGMAARVLPPERTSAGADRR